MNGTIKNIILNSKKTKYILDDVKGSVFAISVDRLNTKATSPLTLSFSNAAPNLVTKFKNGTLDKDHVEAYIKSVNSGNLVGVSAYIQQATDQSGYNNHAIQNTQANQPRIIDNGVWDVDSTGKVCIQAILASDTFLSVAHHSSIDFTTQMSINIIHTVNTSGENAGGRIIDKNNAPYVFIFTTYYMAINGATLSNANYAPSGVKVINTVVLDSTVNSTIYYKNSVLNRTGTFTALPNNTLPMGILNRSTKDRQYDGKLSELILFSRPITNGERIKLEVNQGKRHGIAV